MRDSMYMIPFTHKNMPVPSRTALLALFAMFILIVACGKQTSIGTPTPRPFETVVPTVPPAVVERDQVKAVFLDEIAHISHGEWTTIYQSCTIDFRSRRDLETFIEQAESNFFRQGYTYDGFEARNVVMTTESDDRVSMTYDAYENGEFIRKVTPDGGAFVLVKGEWIDDGINCRTSNRPAIIS